MVTITDFDLTENKHGEQFVLLEVQGGVMPVRSKQTGKVYLTSKKAMVASTYDARTAATLVGQKIPGEVKQVQCEPYNYTIKDTGETITLNHRYEYVDEEMDSTKDKTLISEKEVQQFPEELEEITI